MNLSDAIQQEVFAQVSRAAAAAGMRAYVIGGYVRDALLHRPCKDIDVVVEGKGTVVAKRFAAQVGGEATIFENFGTAMVRYGDYEVEFVGARRESYRRDSRKPIVEEGSLRDDQIRRDFTINALSISLNKEDWGELYDPFAGIADLHHGIIRTPTDPNITFSDDPLRMMRCIRFATQLNFRIEDATYAALCDNRQRIDIISKERINDELHKIILSPKPSIGFRLLFNTGLLPLIFPELAAMHGVEVRNNQGHKDNFYHTIGVLDNLAEMTDDLWLRWVALMHDIGKPRSKRYEPAHGWTFHGHEDIGARMVPKIFAAMKLPQNEKMKYVQLLTQLHQRPIALVNEPVTDSAIRRIVMDAGEYLDDLLTFCRADITSSNPEKVRRFRENYAVLEQRIREVEERDNLRNWQPPITGEIIMQTFNLPPSRAVGDIKTAIREAILEGIIPNDYDAAFAYMQEVAKNVLKK